MKSFAIIPAAGRSRRMGRHKLLMPFGASTVIESVLTAWQCSGVSHVVAVVRPDDDRLIDVCARAGIQPVLPTEPLPEMKNSVAAGLAYVAQHYSPNSADIWLLAPADMPRFSPRVVDCLLAEYDPAAPSTLVPYVGGRHGHPVLFPWPLAEEVKTLGADEGVNAIVARHPQRAVECGDDGILDDLDTMEDYRRLRGESPS